MQVRRTKHYLVSAAAAAIAQTPPVAANPKRIGLFIQNTGSNVGLVRFGGPPLGDGSDIALGAGEREKWTECDTVMTDSINVFSTGGTTFAVVETVGGS